MMSAITPSSVPATMTTPPASVSCLADQGLVEMAPWSSPLAMAAAYPEIAIVEISTFRSCRA